MPTAEPDPMPTDQLSTALRKLLYRRLVAWAIRWVIGFGLIAVAVWTWPEATWLWGVGAAVAALSLAALLSIHFTMAPRIVAKAEDVQTQAQVIDALHESLGDDRTPPATKH